MKRLSSLTAGDRFLYKGDLYTYLRYDGSGSVSCREHSKYSIALGAKGYGKYGLFAFLPENILVEFVPV